MTKFNKTIAKLITSAGALALMAGLNPALVQTAHAYDCLLDTNNDGNADSNVDTDGGANSSGVITRLACGSGANASGSSTTALGHNAKAIGSQTTAVGKAARAAGDESTALGSFAETDLIGTTSVGYAANFAAAVGAYSTALGYYAKTEGTNAIAIGADSADVGFFGTEALGDNSIVIGSDAGDDSFIDTVVIGTGATATQDGQIILGDADTFTIMGGDMSLGTNSPAAFADLQNSRDNGVIIHLDDNTPSTGIPWNIQNTGGELRFTTPPGGAAEKEFVLDADGNLTITGDMSSSQSLLRNNGAVFNKLTDTSTGTVWNFANIGSEARIVSPTVPGVEFKMDINGNVTIMGSITTGGMTCGGGCDAVFSADYDLPSIEEHAKSMFANKHLPAIGATSPNTPVNLSDQYGNLLNELEKAHIYIAQMDAEHKTEMAQQKSEMAVQKAEMMEIKAQLALSKTRDARLTRLEKLLGR